ncbi:ABC transporter permease [Egicoccus sp. AB-alg2]|uniref:ABC transporter permease n=1 Tax=Egicoccus sp. AB-alg2 TaxID=3242693 RepID=UPI00359D6186
MSPTDAIRADAHPETVPADLPVDPGPNLVTRLGQSRWLSLWTTPLILAVVLITWETYVAVTGISRFVLPAPSAVAAAFAEQITDPFVWRNHIWTTFYQVMWGLGFAILLGVGLGFAVGKSQVVDKIIRPFLVATQVVPKVALVPLFILWFGFGPTSKIVIAALLAFFPLLINTAFGVRSVPQSMHDLMTTLGASRWQRFWKAEFPHTLAYILAGMELAVVQATIGAIVGEYLGGDRGLGRYAVNLQMQLQVDKLFGAILMMTIFGFLLYSLVMGTRRYFIPWHESAKPRRRL